MFDQVVVRLNLVEGSDREMYGAEGKQQSLTSAITRLVSKERQLGFDPTSTLLAYRTFLIHNLHGVACADTSLDRQAEAIAFNKIDTKLTGESPELVKTLSVEELRATSIGDSANIEKIGGAPEVERETHRLFLVFAANQKAAHFSDSPDSYMQPEPDDVNAVLRCEADKSAMAAFSPLGQYETKQSTLMLLIDLLPPGPSFEDATDAELAYLNLNPIEQVSPESWLRAFKTLLLISRPIEPTHLRALRETAIKQGGMAMPPSPNAEFIRKKMQHYQSDPAISAYMALEDLFTPVYQTYEESLRKSPL